MAEGEDVEGVSNPDVATDAVSGNEATAQIDDFININIAQIAPDYSNFIHNNQGFIDESDGVELSSESGLPTGFSLSGGSSITISPDSWSTDDAGGADTDGDDISDFESDADSLDAELVTSELRTNDAGPQQADASRGSSSAAAGVSGGAVGAAQSAASNAAAGQAAPAPPTARPTQASRPGRSGNIDQQQTTTVFDQLTAEVVITSVAIVPAIALPSLASTEASTLASLQTGDVQDLPEAEADDRTTQEAAASASDTAATAEPQLVDDAPIEEAIVEPEVEEAASEEDGVPQEGGVETEATEAVVEPEATEEVEAAAPAEDETLVEEIVEEIIEEIEEAPIEDIEDEAIAAANDTIDTIIDTITPQPEPEPAPEEEPLPEPEPEVETAPEPTPETEEPVNEAPSVTAITDTSKSEDSAAYTIDLLNGAADADGDTLSVTNVSVAAVDQDNASYTLPSGAATVSGSTLSIDPSVLSELALNDEVVITVSYDVSDGTTATANTATVTLDGTNEAPSVTAITDTGKSEDSAAYTIDLLNGAADADGDTLSVTNVSVAAVDQDNASYTLPDGAASVSGSTLSIDPATLNGLDTGEEVVIRVTYDVGDGTTTTANTARVTLTGVNDAPTASATSNTLSEEDSTFTLNLLDSADDVDVETLSVTNVSITAVDADGNPVPSEVITATASVSGSTLTVDPNQMDGLNDGQYAVFTVAYDVTDGDASVSNQATVRVNGYTDPFVTITPPGQFTLAENTAGDGTAVALGQVTANGHTTVSYSFANGTQAEGDFRIDSSSGAITYVGTGENFEEGGTPSNIAAIASLSTTVTSFLNFTVDQALANMVDGNKSTSGIYNYSVHPRNADGDTITFDFDDNYTDPTFVFYSRTGAGAAVRIDGSTVEYKYQGQTVHTETLDSSTMDNYVITLDSPDNFDFDQVVLTFDGDTQNFREVEIMARLAPIQSLEVRATSGSVSDTVFVDVDITDVAEDLVLANALADQTGIMATSSDFTIPADSFNDPDGTEISYSATLSDGSGLPSWLTFNPSNRTFSISDQSPSGRFEVRVIASSGGQTVTDDFTLLMAENFAPQAAISTDVSEWLFDGTDENLAAMIDGNMSTDGTLDYIVHPRNADGLEIVFDMLGSFQAGSFIFHNRTGSSEDIRDRINGSTVTFKQNGSAVFTDTLLRTNEVGGIITLTPSADIVFDEVVLTFDGASQNFREVEILGLPMVTFTSAESFTINENTGNTSVFTLAAAADAAVTYSFIDGTQTSGDYSINAQSGVITYNGSGFDFENSGMINRAPAASVTTTVESFLRYDVATALANMTDGNLSSSGVDNYAVHPQNADGKNIVFSFTDDLVQGALLLHNRVGDLADRIDGSVVDFNLNGMQVHTDTLYSSNAANSIIRIDAPVDVIFDQVTITFSGDAQNFREVEIFGVPDGTGALFVRATSGSYWRDTMVDIIVGDVNEAPQPNQVIGDQTITEGDKTELLLADDLFIDPEGDNMTLSATLADGNALPSFIMFDAAEGDFLFEPEVGDAEKYDIRVYASDGQLNAFTEFSLTVEDI